MNSRHVVIVQFSSLGTCIRCRLKHIPIPLRKLLVESRWKVHDNCWELDSAQARPLPLAELRTRCFLGPGSSFSLSHPYRDSEIKFSTGIPPRFLPGGGREPCLGAKPNGMPSGDVSPTATGTAQGNSARKAELLLK